MRSLSPSVSLALACALALPGLCSAASFTAGNLVIYRVGTGAAALSSAATAVFLDEYTTTGALVQSIALPTAVSGANQPLTASGSATSEGLMTRSTDGRYLMLTGYSAVPGTLAVAGTASATTPRVVGRADAAGNVDTTTALTDFSNLSNPRSTVSTTGTDLWITGGAGGIRYATLGGTTSVQLATTPNPTNLRQTRIVGGQMYTSSASGAFRLATVGAGLPTTAGQTITNLPGFPTSGGSPYGFLFADLDAGVAGVDTVYVADDGAGATAGIWKYSLVGGTWTANGNIVAAGVRGLTGTVTGTSVQLFGTANGFLYTLTDTTGYNVTIAGTVTTLTTIAAGANIAFRGIDWAPVSAAVPPLEAWRVAHFGAGATNSGTAANDADYDGDGVKNLVEYALGTDPVSVNGPDGAAALPSSVTGSSNPLLNDRLAITFTIPSTTPTDITYIVKGTTDLTDWTPVATKIGAGAWTWNPGGTSHIVTTSGGATTMVEVGDLTDSASALRRGLRLEITTP